MRDWVVTYYTFDQVWYCIVCALNSNDAISAAAKLAGLADTTCLAAHPLTYNEIVTL